MAFDKFEKGDKTVIVGGIVDSSGIIETSVTVCEVVEVGKSDLLVKFDRKSSPPRIVSKSACVPIHVDKNELLNAKPLLPDLGDMVFYRGKVNWRDKEETTCVGTVYEIKLRDGAPTTATVHTGNDMVALPYSELLVLQRRVVS